MQGLVCGKQSSDILEIMHVIVFYLLFASWEPPVTLLTM